MADQARPMRVLVAEDEPGDQHILEVGLTQLGHQVELCADGETAWEAYRRGRHEVVVTDWVMPGMDGFDLCRRIRAHPSRTYTYVVLLTGKAGINTYHEAIAAGVDDFLHKPLDPDLLAARLTVASRIVGLHQHARVLESLLHVCAWCKRIRDGESWTSLETYLSRHVGGLSHGICPTCYARLARETGDLSEAG